MAGSYVCVDLCCLVGSVVDFPNVPGEEDALWAARPPEHHQAKEDLEA
jgi:hypothetical protein